MFEGFGIQYLFGATVFGFINLAAIVFFFVAVLLIWAAIIFVTNNGKVIYSDFKYLGIGALVSVLFVLLLIPSMVVHPRVTIDIPPNQSQVEFQGRERNIEIITPAPRVEIMEGFRPLREK